MKALIIAALLTLTVLSVAPTAQAEPQCMEVYSRHDVGDYAIVRRNTCSVEVYECPSPGAELSQCWSLVR